LDLVANALVEYETLSKEEMEKVVRGEKLEDKLKAGDGIPIKMPDLIKGKTGGVNNPSPFPTPPDEPSGTPGGGLGAPTPVPGGSSEPPRPYPAGG
jgi:ATP-dependent metalloprotease